jgi:hypothetical protein
MLLTARSLYYCIVGFSMNAYLDLPDPARLAAFTTPSVADHFGFGVLLCRRLYHGSSCVLVDFQRKHFRGTCIKYELWIR